MFAVIATGGKQYKVAVGDEINVEKLDVDVDTAVDLPALMVVGDDDKVAAGPDVKATVKATVVDQFKGPKLRIFHYRNKTGYRRKKGHRQNLTRIRVEAINA